VAAPLALASTQQNPSDAQLMSARWRAPEIRATATTTPVDSSRQISTRAGGAGTIGSRPRPGVRFASAASLRG
jgi:hypothetical protein